MKPLTVEPGKLVLFRVTSKRSDKEPDWRGACNIEGQQFELGIWQRESKRGLRYLAGTIKPVRDQAMNDDRPPQDV